MRFSSSYLVVGCLVQMAYSDQAWRPVLVCDISMGHLGNFLVPQQTESIENIIYGKLVFYGCIFYLEYVAYFGTGFFLRFQICNVVFIYH
jgi:hypothetical protein